MENIPDKRGNTNVSKSTTQTAKINRNARITTTKATTATQYQVADNVETVKLDTDHFDKVSKEISNPYSVQNPVTSTNNEIGQANTSVHTTTYDFKQVDTPTFSYDVKKGDTLSQIANDHHISLEQLFEENPDLKTHPDDINEGDQINLPLNIDQDHNPNNANSMATTTSTSTNTTSTTNPSVSQNNSLNTSQQTNISSTSKANLPEMKNSSNSNPKPHTVESGDTLSQIAKNYGVSVKELAEFNGISNPDFIEIGQIIQIPARPEAYILDQGILCDAYSIKRGDTLSQIAQNYGLDYQYLAKINQIKDPDYIESGDTIYIPNPDKVNAFYQEQLQKIIKAIQKGETFDSIMARMSLATPYITSLTTENSQAILRDIKLSYQELIYYAHETNILEDATFLKQLNAVNSILAQLSNLSIGGLETLKATVQFKEEGPVSSIEECLQEQTKKLLQDKNNELDNLITSYQEWIQRNQSQIEKLNQEDSEIETLLNQYQELYNSTESLAFETAASYQIYCNPEKLNELGLNMIQIQEMNLEDLINLCKSKDPDFQELYRASNEVKEQLNLKIQEKFGYDSYDSYQAAKKELLAQNNQSKQRVKDLLRLKKFAIYDALFNQNDVKNTKIAEVPDLNFVTIAPKLIWQENRISYERYVNEFGGTLNPLEFYRQVKIIYKDCIIELKEQDLFDNLIKQDNKNMIQLYNYFYERGGRDLANQYLNDFQEIKDIEKIDYQEEIKNQTINEAKSNDVETKIPEGVKSFGGETVFVGPGNVTDLPENTPTIEEQTNIEVPKGVKSFGGETVFVGPGNVIDSYENSIDIEPETESGTEFQTEPVSEPVTETSSEIDPIDFGQDAQDKIPEILEEIEDETIENGIEPQTEFEPSTETESQTEQITEPVTEINSKIQDTNLSSEDSPIIIDPEITTPSLSTISPYQDLLNQIPNSPNFEIDLSNIQPGSRVFNALEKYKEELITAKYAVVTKDIFIAINEEIVEGNSHLVSHIVINDPSQIKGEFANGAYMTGEEKPSSAAERIGSRLLINGSHFIYGTGEQDLYNNAATNNNDIVIFDGQIQRSVSDYAGGWEICLDKNGKLFNAPQGTSAQQLIDEGVLYTFTSHDAHLINNKEQYYENNDAAKLSNVIGMVEPGEYYILTGTSSNYAESDYLYNKGCSFAKSMDQGGSVALVIQIHGEQKLITTPTDESGERPVGDFLAFF